MFHSDACVFRFIWGVSFPLCTAFCKHKVIKNQTKADSSTCFCFPLHGLFQTLSWISYSCLSLTLRKGSSNIGLGFLSVPWVQVHFGKLMPIIDVHRLLHLQSNTTPCKLIHHLKTEQQNPPRLISYKNIS